jgi:hypothetical protein
METWGLPGFRSRWTWEDVPGGTFRERGGQGKLAQMNEGRSDVRAADTLDATGLGTLGGRRGLPTLRQG